MAMLEAPLKSVDAYVAYFAHQDLPVLRRTVRELEALGEMATSVNSRELAAIVLADPLMTMRLLSWLQNHRRASQNHDITTIDRAIMMIGVDPFLEAFCQAPTLEAQLTEHPKALLGALQLIARARQAARHARDWALLRHDLDADEITVATLLHEATEIMLWVFAPTLMLRVAAMQSMDPKLRSSVAQKVVFGVEAVSVQRELVRVWKLPELLVSLLDSRCRDNPRVRNVELASRFTRHVATGWDDAGLPDDIDELCRLLPLNREALLRRLGAPPDAFARLLGSQD